MSFYNCEWQIGAGHQPKVVTLGKEGTFVVEFVGMCLVLPQNVEKVEEGEYLYSAYSNLLWKHMDVHDCNCNVLFKLTGLVRLGFKGLVDSSSGVYDISSQGGCAMDVYEKGMKALYLSGATLFEGTRKAILELDTGGPSNLGGIFDKIDFYVYGYSRPNDEVCKALKVALLRNLFSSFAEGSKVLFNKAECKSVVQAHSNAHSNNVSDVLQPPEMNVMEDFSMASVVNEVPQNVSNPISRDELRRKLAVKRKRDQDGQ